MAFVRAGGRRADFLRRAILSRRVAPAQNRQSNMDTLVALGSTTAFGYSAWALLSRRGRTSLFHGSRRHHHAHQRRPLARSPRQRQGRRRVEIAAESRAANGAETDSESGAGRNRKADSNQIRRSTFGFEFSEHPQSAAQKRKLRRSSRRRIANRRPRRAAARRPRAGGRRGGRRRFRRGRSDAHRRIRSRWTKNPAANFSPAR